LDDLLVAPGFDKVVGEQADAALTISDDVDLLPHPDAEVTNESRSQVNE